MKVFKSLFLVLIVMFTSVFVFACGDKEEEKTPTPDVPATPDAPVQLEKIKVLLPNGAPLMAIGGLLDSEAFDFEVVNGADPLSAALLGNDYDMIIAPLNLGAKLSTAGKTKYKIDSLITVNNTYIVSKEKLESAEDLKDITVLAYGQNSTPDIVLKASNKKFGLNMKLNYEASVNDVMSKLVAGSSDSQYSLMAYPQVTKIQNALGKDNINVLDVVSLFGDDIVFPQACLYVNSEKDKDYSAHLKLIEENIKLANEKPEDYARVIADKNPFFVGLGETVIAESLPHTNIVYLKAKDNKKAVNDYVDYLNEYVPNLLQGKTLSDDFYN